MTIQRSIKVGAEVYHDRESLDRAFGEKVGKMLWLLPEEFDRFDKGERINLALKDPREILFVQDPDGGFTRSATVSAKETQLIGGGVQIEAGGDRPQVIYRPNHGASMLKIAGILNCVGIFVEAKKGQEVMAVSGLHFVTPRHLSDEGDLTEEAQALIKEQVRMVKDSGNLVAILEISPQADNATMVANMKITEFLKSKGVDQVLGLKRTGDRIYKLQANGQGGLNV